MLILAGPQIVFSLYGNNWWGIETSRGYARIHVPISGSSMEIKAPILIPKCTNIWSALLNWFQNKNPELRDPRLLVNGTKNNGKLIILLRFLKILKNSSNLRIINGIIRRTINNSTVNFTRCQKFITRLGSILRRSELWECWLTGCI